MTTTIESAHITQDKPLKHYFIMTVDVDGWSSLLRYYGVDHDVSQADLQVDIAAGISRLLYCFKKHGISATFFVTGEMALKHPEIIEMIDQRGHEVACHGLFHWKDEYISDSKKQENNIKKATNIIEDLTKRHVVGFRAPCLRINNETYRILSDVGYLYDSSSIPTYIPGYYGQPNFRFRPYWIKSTSNKGMGTLLEIPISVNPLMFIPLSAAWMRNLGMRWVKLGVSMNYFFKNPLVLYVHPRDVLSLPRVKGVPWHVYRNVGFTTIKMLDEVFEHTKTLGASFMNAADFAFALYEVGVGNL